MASPVTYDVKNVPVRCVNAELGTVRTATTRLDEITVSQEDLTSIPQGSWRDVCILHGIQREGVVIAAEMVRERGSHGAPGLQSDWEVASSQAVAMAKQTKRSYSPHSVLMWILETDHPDPWALLGACVSEVQEEKGPNPPKGPSEKDQIRKFTRKLGDSFKTQEPLKTQCASCGRCTFEKLSKCEGCNVIRYCNKTCQTAHWKIHKQICAKIKQRHRDDQTIVSSKRATKKFLKAVVSKQTIVAELEEWSLEQAEKERGQPSSSSSKEKQRQEAPTGQEP